MKAKDYCEVNWSEIVFYDETSPSCLRWKTDLYREDGKRFRRFGEVVGCSKNSAYWKVIHNGKVYVCHRIIYILFNGAIQSEDKIDHIDGDGYNNIISNLRLTTQQLNSHNRRKRIDNISSTTGVMLVARNKGTTLHWEAQWMEHGTRKLKSKSFAVKKYGYDEAFQMACEYRRHMLSEQNEAGAGYTCRHGL